MSPYYMGISGQFLHCGCYGRFVIRMKNPPPRPLVVRKPDIDLLPLACSHYSKGLANFPKSRGTDDHMFEHPNLFLGDVVSIGWPKSYKLHPIGIVLSPGIVFTWQRDCRLCTNSFFKRQMESSTAGCPFAHRHDLNMVGCSARGIITNIPEAVQDGDNVVPLNIEIISRSWLLLRVASSMFINKDAHKPLLIPKAYSFSNEEVSYVAELNKWKRVVAMGGNGTNVQVSNHGVLTISSDIDTGTGNASLIGSM